VAFNNFVTLAASGGSPSYSLTDQGRTFAMSRDERSVPVNLANGLTKKYFMAVKYSFNLEWQMLPGPQSRTFDKKHARDAIKELVDLEDTLLLTLQRTSTGSPSGTTTSHTVWVESYNEDIVRRDFGAGIIWYNVKLDLKEQ